MLAGIFWHLCCEAAGFVDGAWWESGGADEAGSDGGLVVFLSECWGKVDNAGSLAGLNVGRCNDLEAVGEGVGKVVEERFVLPAHHGLAGDLAQDLVLRVLLAFVQHGQPALHRMYFWPLSLSKTSTYSKSGWTAMRRFEGKVQGVVV